jgi:enoyl-CoA hydratase
MPCGYAGSPHMAATMDNDFFSLDPGADSGIGHLQLNRPERLNTMAPAFFPAFRDAVRALDDGGRTRVLVISSTGRHFSAGMALEVFAQGNAMLDTRSARARLAFHDGLRRLMACFDVLEQARFPVLCAVQGGCVGGALDLAAACDIRLASADAFFVVQEIHLGMAADLGVLQRLPKIVPPGVAREMAYTGDRLPAARALAVGLVNVVAEDAAALLERTMTMARTIAERSPLAVAGSKQAIGYAVDHSTGDALQQMALLQGAIFEPADIAAAAAAGRDKRAATFAALHPAIDL